MKSDLRLTDTNAASDSKGKTWGLDGNLFWYLIGGLAAGITVFFALLVGFQARFVHSIAIAVVPLLLCLAYIYGLRQGKPPGYDRDCFEYWLRGRGFGPELSQPQKVRHPLAND